MTVKRLFVRLLPLFFAIVVVLPASAGAPLRGLPDFTELVEKQGAAVVNVSTTQALRHGRTTPQLPMDEDDPMFDFFRRFIPPRQGGQPPREYESRSLGSGFIISVDGYVLTNAHVIDAADEITVKLTDKREFRARVIGSDKRTDVALIKIDASGLPTVKLGDPNALKVGEWVIAIGSPFGFDNSVTAGIVSAKGRSLPDENYVPFIQTDVAINPGNSGGPLFNMKGEVVGINSQIYSRTGGYMGLAFAIPIDMAMEVQNQLKSSGKVSRGRIGVTIQEVSKDLADSFGLSKPAGALVNSVEPGGPADKAGIVPGDVILKFDGKPVSASSDLPRIVGGTKPGSKVQLDIWRKGTAKALAISVGEILDEKIGARAVNKRAKPVEPTANRLGLIVSELSAEQRKELKIAGGVMVDDARGNGGRNDVRPGDVIISIAHKGVTTELTTVSQFNKLLAQMERGSNITLLLRRGEVQLFVAIKVPGDNK